MIIEKCVKSSFAVIGKEGSTRNGPGFVQLLWQEANSHFDEVVHLAKRNEQGNFAGFWGAMTDFSFSFLPWENDFSQGLYLAGVECGEDAQPLAGWTKWIIPGFEYLRVACDRENVFAEMIAHLAANQIPLAGAVHDFTCPTTGQNYMYFPIKRLD